MNQKASSQPKSGVLNRDESRGDYRTARLGLFGEGIGGEWRVGETEGKLHHFERGLALFDAIIPFNKFEIFVEEGERKWKKREKKEKQQNF